jgi:hypothetical protein
MAKASAKKSNPSTKSESMSEPKFPYAATPNALRKFLRMVPNKPRPNKVNEALLKSWGLRGGNDKTMIRVLKALKLVGQTNEPTPRYTEYMLPRTGPAILAVAAREVWAPLFESSHEPYKEDDSTLRNLFNVHSGGSENTISQQIQTFKAVCDNSDFSAESAESTHLTSSTTNNLKGAVSSGHSETTTSPNFHIDLHIHLPENKSRRDYEYIFEDIARYIFGREINGGGRDRD